MVEMLERKAALRVGVVEISPAQIAAEAQHHRADDAEQAWQEAAKALAIRELLLAEADRQQIEAGECRDQQGRRLDEDDARIDALLEHNVIVPQATIDEARRFYESHSARFCSETMVEAQHILFSASPEDAMAYGFAISDARRVLGQITKHPSRFAALARAHSACPSKTQGGNLGQIGPGQTVADFERALFALGEGEITAEPVRSPYGVHIIRAGRRIEGQKLPFAAVRQSICNYLEEASYRRAMAQYLSILASEAEIEGVRLAGAEGPLVQ